MPPGSWVMRDKSLSEALAEIEEAQHCPEQEIQGIVSQIAFEPSLHRAMPYPILRPDQSDPDRSKSSFEGRHACEGETSMMLAISQETVRTDKIPDVWGACRSQRRSLSGVVLYDSIRLPKSLRTEEARATPPRQRRGRSS